MTLRLYTKRGDSGETSLLGGKTAGKHDQRVRAYGAVDELNAFLGLAALKTSADTRGTIRKIQSDLFSVGADLAACDEKTKTRTSDKHVKFIETKADEVGGQLPELKNFVLPSGCEAAVLLHVARTVCRRAERHAAKLKQENYVNPLAIVYLNRMSSLLFGLALLENKRAGIEEQKWVGE